jgi:hypothetical protein
MSVLPISMRRRKSRRRSASTGATALVTLAVTFTAVFLGQTGTASAVTAPPAAKKPAATAAPKAGDRTTAPTAVPKATTGRKPAAKGAAALPATPPGRAGKRTAKATAGRKTVTHKHDAKAEHTTAAHQIARLAAADDQPDTCSGPIDPDTVYTCSAWPDGGTTFTLHLTRATDLVFIQVVTIDDQDAYPQVTAPDGTAVTCDQPGGYGSALRCPTDQAGPYTLEAAAGFGGFSVSYTPLLSDTSCTAVTDADDSLGGPADFAGTLASGSAGTCWTVPLAAGDVLRAHLSDWRVTATVYDADGTQVCSNRAKSATTLDCPLTGTAPFRVLTDQDYADSLDYSISLARLSAPTGCPTVQPQAYATVPDATSTDRCRLLHVPAAGPYLFGPTASDHGVTGSLFDTDGTAMCLNQTTPCTLAAGDYTWARDADDSGPAAYGLWFHATNATAGCTAARDDDYASGRVTGNFTGAGEQVCLTLPTATGQGLYVLNDTPDDAAAALDTTIYDARGVQQCDAEYSFNVCKLTGTAPFHLVLTNTSMGADPGAGTGAYLLTVQRTGSIAGCTPWAQSAFGGAWGGQASLTADRQTACLGIAAGKHSTAEMFDFTNSTNQLNASVQIYDGAGDQVCASLGNSTAACRFTAGTDYAALLVGAGWTDTYQLSRRDVSSTATCTTPKSLTVGGASTGYTFTSALDSTCLRVTGAATDKMWISERTPTAGYETGADLGVVDATGTIVCWQFGPSCRVTGSTSYVAFVLAAGYNGTPIVAHMDTWRIGTASGWAPQCTANPLSTDGFPLRSGTFTETATAYCAVVSMKPSQRFVIYGTHGSTTGPPAVSLLSNTRYSGTSVDNSYQCDNLNYGDFDFQCQTDGGAPTGQYALVVTMDEADAPAEYSMQGVCTDGCTTPHLTADVSSLSPASGPTGTWNQVVLHGTNLTLGSSVALAGNGVSGGYGAEPVSVSADGTTLTVWLDTYDLDPGTYDIVVDQPGYTTGVRSPGYLPGAYTVTAAATTTQSRFVPVTPTRFLDTRDGTGAPKAQVGAGGTVKLAVAGAHGVPATGITAVVMNVTAVNPATGGHITVYPDGQTLPSVSTLSYSAGRTIANLVTVAVRDGTVDLQNSAGSVDLLADVTGYYTDGSSGSALTPLTPTRFLDTRNGTGAPRAQVGAGGVVKLKVAGAHGVPATGVTAVAMNVTAVSPTTAGHITVYPDGQSVPGVSNVSFGAATTIANMVIVPVVNGTVDLQNSAGSVDLLADVTGYFSATGSTFTSADPLRMLDTRSGLGARTGAVGPGGVVSMNVLGDGVPSDGVTAVALDVTVTAPTATSHLTVSPHGQPVPGVSNLNFTAGETIANLVIVPVVDGRISFTNNSGNVQVIADLEGYYSS